MPSLHNRLHSEAGGMYRIKRSLRKGCAGRLQLVRKWMTRIKEGLKRAIKKAAI
ncbi:hypothetical protein [Pseudomonas phage vB_PaeM_RP7]|nr:MAG: hypothetical protein [Pseudomonas phage RP4]WAB56722.1 hypothetical protein [Pseudomonas phage vB_PaeM_RP15]WAB57008.1 hypothetical protein [Pseudomonas phage vB_PaeM_RP6]WAB57083.1 hypothetical protein [Pseudomonas phage vB_PaeM_RP7]WAB57220.1 hypothetical protein [Pseudomonas phage vB_PaeM_RP8]WAB57518.1 hypothetical protein [Pseudomonas phage vB_PaeM_RP9]WAB57635.1 hypothetical protein [Pseudomonas phage vB_PaeM_RP10]WAB57751.1 hypothetical protein [Pseudomonas phage vB_PaeM_RP11]